MLCYEEQNLPQSAGSHTIGTPPPSTEITGGLRGLAAHPQDSHQDPDATKDGSNGTILEATLYCKSHFCVKFQLTIKCMLVLLPIFLCAYRDTETLTTVKFILDLIWRRKRGSVETRTRMRTQDPRLAPLTKLAAKDRTKERLVSA